MRKSNTALRDRNPPPQCFAGMRMMKWVKGEYQHARLQLGASTAPLGASVVQSDRGDVSRRLNRMVANAHAFLSGWRAY